MKIKLDPGLELCSGIGRDEVRVMVGSQYIYFLHQLTLKSKIKDNTFLEEDKELILGVFSGK